MPRTRYYRKRPGHRAFIASLWQVLHPYMEPAKLEGMEPDLSGLRSAGLSDEQIVSLRAILAELGEECRIGLGVVRLSNTPPDFFAIGAEMLALRFGSPSPRLQHFLKPNGRQRSARVAPLRPQQTQVDTWMLDRAAFAFNQGEPTLKEIMVVSECMAAINASRAQARAGFGRLPPELRRQRGQHDRWVVYRAPNLLP